MPSRKDIFTNGSFYHIFNKTIDHKLIFADQKNAKVFLNLLRYYRSTKSTIRYSHFRKLPPQFKLGFEKRIMIAKYFKIEILTFCLMPNHFHLLIRQLKKDGIVSYLSNITNSITRFYNISKERKGPVFLPQFRSRRILTREQLIHVSRYHHLNPYSAGIVNSLSELMTYPWSSFNEYLGMSLTNLCNTEIILKEFNGNKENYKNFVLSNAEHQRTLENVKYVKKWV